MTARKPQNLKEKLADSYYQPTKEEMERSYDMPVMSYEEVRQAFFNPVVLGRPKPDRE